MAGIARHISVHSAAMTIFLPAGLLNPFRNTRILPRIDERAINRLLVGKNILNRLDDKAALLLKHGCQQRRHAKNLRRLCESYDVVDNRLGIVTAQTGELEWLMVNQNQHAIVGSEEGLKARF